MKHHFRAWPDYQKGKRNGSPICLYRKYWVVAVKAFVKQSLLWVSSEINQTLLLSRLKLRMDEFHKSVMKLSELRLSQLSSWQRLLWLQLHRKMFLLSPFSFLERNNHHTMDERDECWMRHFFGQEIASRGYLVTQRAFFWALVSLRVQIEPRLIFSIFWLKL